MRDRRERGADIAEHLSHLLVAILVVSARTAPKPA